MKQSEFEQVQYQQLCKIMNSEDIGSCRKLVSVALLLHRNKESLECRVGINDLAGQTSFVHRVVKRTIQNLIEQEIIEKTGEDCYRFLPE